MRVRAATRAARILAIFAALLVIGCGQGSDTERAVQAEIRRQLGQGFRLFRRPTVDADDIQPYVRRFYRERGYRPAWTGSRGPTGDAHAFVQTLEAAPQEGLDPSAYAPGEVARLMKDASAGLIGPRPPARLLATLDVRLTRTFLEYAAHLSTGRVDPRALPADWHITRPRADLVPVLAQAIGAHRVGPMLHGLPPSAPGYAQLRGALERYRAIAAAGGWTRLAPEPALRSGSRGPQVTALCARLAAEGYLPAFARRARVFDGSVAGALRAFQTRHGLDPDGVLDHPTLVALNVPVAVRIRQIELNMERWRWVPANLGERFIMVNIPAYTLELVDGGRRELSSRVVVGRQYTPTPMFSDRITYLVINPSWNVPARIANEEILPMVRDDPDYLRRSGMRVFESSAAETSEVDPGSVDWYWVSSDNSKYTLRQQPGPSNPLGHVKFMCPNQFDVYLHDTPSGHLFEADARSLSHGCVRVEKATELAERLLEGVPGGNRQGLLDAFASNARDSVVSLPRAVPVHLFYWTAWVDEQGGVEFRDDVYGLDRTLAQAMASGSRGV